MRRTTPLTTLATACMLTAACTSTPPGWRDGTPLPMARLEAFAATLGGRIYYLGGIEGMESDITTAHPSTRVDVFDPSTRTWSRGPDLPAEAPKHHLAVVVHHGALYILGGFDGIIGRNLPGDAFHPIPTTWVLQDGAWRRLADAPLARGAATAQSIGDAIYVAGGTTNEGVDPFADLYAYDPATDQWSARAPMHVAREHLASCALGGAMIVVGGWAGALRPAQSAAESYDPATDRWTTLAPLPTPRGGLGAIALNGRCHVVGGEDWSLTLPGTYAVMEVFDPSLGTWATDAPMHLARHGSGVTVFDNEIYVLGGGPAQGNTYTDRVEIDHVE